MKFAFASPSLVAVGLFAATAAMAQQQPAPTPSAQQPGAAPAPGAADAAGPAAKLGIYVYPTKGQTQDQLITDEAHCYSWAKQQTGIDPTTVKPNTDSAQKAAKAKADSMGAHGRKKKAAEQQSEQQATMQAQGQANQQVESFRKAMAACLEGRGYTASTK